MLQTKIWCYYNWDNDHDFMDMFMAKFKKRYSHIQQ
jgi:hypothetical protein